MFQEPSKASGPCHCGCRGEHYPREKEEGNPISLPSTAGYRAPEADPTPLSRNTRKKPMGQVTPNWIGENYFFFSPGTKAKTTSPLLFYFTRVCDWTHLIPWLLKKIFFFSFWSRYFLMGLIFGFEITGLLALWINACCCVENAYIGDHSIKPNLNSLVSSICKCYVSTSLWFFWFSVLSCCVQCQRWNVDKNIYI